MAIDVKSSEFENLILKQSFEKPVLVDFWATWCKPCEALGKILDDLERIYENKIIFTRVNTETEKQLAINFNVSSIPLVAIFYKGKMKDQFLGVRPKTEIVKFLEKNLPNEKLEKAIAFFSNNEVEKASEIILTEKIKSPESDNLIWKIILYNLKTKPNLEFIKKFVDIFSDFGSTYFDHKQKLKQMLNYPKNSEEILFFKDILNPEMTKDILENLLNKIAETSGDEKEKFKNYIFVCFLILEENPLVNEYRRRLSRLLF